MQTNTFGIANSKTQLTSAVLLIGNTNFTLQIQQQLTHVGIITSNNLTCSSSAVFEFAIPFVATTYGIADSTD